LNNPTIPAPCGLDQYTLQHSLFEKRGFPNHAPVAAKADPRSSHFAAAEVTASGRCDSQKREILAVLQAQSEPCTSTELARATGMDRYIVARRLPDLERDGVVQRSPMRECNVTARPAITWRTKEAA
jgi:hypothetical protein